MDYRATRQENEDFRQSLYSMRESGMFCDATIYIPGEVKSLPVHRAVMSSCSEFFRTLFTGGFQETHQQDVRIHGVSFKIMDLLIKYAYTNKAVITSDNVQELFAAADRFNILGLLDDCIKFLACETCSENCIGILKFAQIYQSRILRDKAWRYIMSNFKEITEKSSEFYELTVDEFHDILKDDTLNVKSEDEVFEAVVKWVESRPGRERRQLFCMLLDAVRFPYCSEDYIQDKVMLRRDLKRGPCWDRINVSFRLIRKFRSSQDPTVKSETNRISKWIEPRIPNNVLFVVGGWAKEGVTDSVETYDRNADQWFLIQECELPTPRAYHSTLTLQGNLYVIGGFNGTHYLNSVICLDVTKKEWEERAPMYMSRCYVSVAVIENTIYALGGYDGRQRHNSVEKYGQAKNQWTLVKPMFNQRSDAGATAHKGKLYVAGGFDGQSCLMSAEVYDPNLDQWTQLAPMFSRRSGVSLVTCHGDVYAVGGYDGMVRLNSVEYLNNTNHWTAAPNMILGRSNFSCTVIDDVIYVMGGYDGNKTSQQVECFDPVKKQWRVLNDMHVGRSAVSACVIRDIPNAGDFTFHGNQRRGRMLEEVGFGSEPSLTCCGDRDNMNPLYVRDEQRAEEEDVMDTMDQDMKDLASVYL